MTREELIEYVVKWAGTQRNDVFPRAVNLAINRSVKSIVGTGCYRGNNGDGFSDLILSKTAEFLGATYDCVDIEGSHVALAKELVGELPGTRFHCSCSVQYLRSRTDPIGFLYLDSMDFDGTEEAQIHQLREAEAALPLLTPNAIVLLDDVGSNDTTTPKYMQIDNHGKGRLSSKFLIDHGFECLERSYQWLFARR